MPHSRTEGLPWGTPRFWLLLVAQSIFGLGWSSYLIMPKFLATELGANAATIGHVGAMSGLSAVCAIAIATALIDRVVRRTLFQSGAVLLVLLSLGFLFVTRVSALVYLLQGATGAAFVLTFNASVALATDKTPAHRFGQVIGILGAANMATNAISTVLAESLANHFGWHVVFWTTAGLGAMALALSFAIKAEPPVAGPRKPLPLVSALNPSLVLVLCVTSLAGGAFVAMFIFHQPYALSLGATNVAPFFVGFTLASVFVRVFFGSLGDRRGRRGVSVIALGLYGATLFSMRWLHVEWLWAHGVAFGCAHGVLYPTLNALAVELAPPAVRGRAITLFNGSFNVGNSLSMLAWGTIAQRWGYPAIYLIASGVAGLAAVLLWRGGLRRPVPVFEAVPSETREPEAASSPTVR